MPARPAQHTRPDKPKAWQHAAWKSSDRGYGAKWRKVRDLVLRSEPLCRTCSNAGRLTAATEVDHIVPKSQGGDDQVANLQPICRSCHNVKTQAEARA